MGQAWIYICSVSEILQKAIIYVAKKINAPRKPERLWLHRWFAVCLHKQASNYYSPFCTDKSLYGNFEKIEPMTLLISTSIKLCDDDLEHVDIQYLGVWS